MNTLKTLSLVVLLFFFSVEAGAQGTRRRGSKRPAVTKPAVDQPGTPARPEMVAPAAVAPSAPIPLATVNGESITTANIDPKVRQEVEALDARIAEARRQVLDLQINTLLLESEAAKRRMSPQQLYNLEIAKKITEPTAAEIDQFIQDNRDQIAEAGLVFSGINPDLNLVEYVELPREVHPYYIATQAHPELRSRPTQPHPLFQGLVGAALERHRSSELFAVEED